MARIIGQNSRLWNLLFSKQEYFRQTVSAEFLMRKTLQEQQQPSVKFHMRKAYHKIMRQYSKISLAEEIVLRHIGFIAFRIRRRVFPEYLKRFGEDLLSDSLSILYQKVKTYDLKYRNRRGHPKPVKFASYIWKRIDGHIIDSLKKELAKDKKAKLEEVLYIADSDEEFM